jgi:hypothetical protein
MMSYALQYRSTQPGYELNDHKAAVTFRRQISQYGAVHAGYGYRSAAYRGSLLENIRSDDLDIGLDYSRALPFSRRTTFAVGTGSFILSDGHARRFRGTGYALLNHQISRAWNARLEYRRPLQFIEGIATPLVADSIVGSIGGPVARRMNLTVSTWSSRGAAGLATANKFET